MFRTNRVTFCATIFPYQNSFLGDCPQYIFSPCRELMHSPIHVPTKLSNCFKFWVENLGSLDILKDQFLLCFYSLMVSWKDRVLMTGCIIN